MTAYGTVETAVAAMKEGAYDFITKPVKRHAIVKSVRQALEQASARRREPRARAQLAELASGAPGALLGNAAAFRAVLDTLRQAAPTSATVLLVGESGTGKELAARLVHDRLAARAPGRSCRSTAPRIPRGCSSRSCSATRRARSPAPRRARRAASSAPRRHALPRRGRRDVARRPGEAPALPAGRRARARRRHRADPRRRARRRRDEQGPRRRGEGRALPRGPLLPARRGVGAPAAAARAARGRARARERFLRRFAETNGSGDRVLRRGASRPSSGTAGPATSASSCTRWSAR